jgi:hypothetical protein
MSGCSTVRRYDAGASSKTRRAGQRPALKKIETKSVNRTDELLFDGSVGQRQHSCCAFVHPVFGVEHVVTRRARVELPPKNPIANIGSFRPLLRRTHVFHPASRHATEGEIDPSHIGSRRYCSPTVRHAFLRAKLLEGGPS